LLLPVGTGKKKEVDIEGKKKEQQLLELQNKAEDLELQDEQVTLSLSLSPVRQFSLSFPSTARSHTPAESLADG
jgi:hypothetical protein